MRGTPLCLITTYLPLIATQQLLQVAWAASPIAPLADFILSSLSPNLGVEAFPTTAANTTTSQNPAT